MTQINWMLIISIQHIFFLFAIYTQQTKIKHTKLIEYSIDDIIIEIR